jgi:hypothetical protein
MRYEINVNCEKVRKKKKGAVAYLELLPCIFLQVDGNVRDNVFLVRAMTVFVWEWNLDSHILDVGTTYMEMGGQPNDLASLVLGKNSLSGRGPEPVWTLGEKKTDVLF